MGEINPLQSGDLDRVGEYELFGRIGEGPRGVLYLGRRSGDEPARAIKVLPPRPDAGADERERLTGRLGTAQRVTTSYAARLISVGWQGDHPYLVREYVEGRSLRQAVAEDGPLAGEELERLAVGTLTALTSIRLAGIAHRSFNPNNVLLGTDGPRVSDIGIDPETGTQGSASGGEQSGAYASGEQSAPGEQSGVSGGERGRASGEQSGASGGRRSGASGGEQGGEQSGARSGEHGYRSPEQVRNEPAGPSTDVWSWAATMVYAATGLSPFGDDQEILNGTPQLGATPQPLRRLLAACLAKEVAKRPTAQMAMLQLLDGGSTARPASPDAVPDRPSKASRLSPEPSASTPLSAPSSPGRQSVAPSSPASGSGPLVSASQSGAPLSPVSGSVPSGPAGPSVVSGVEPGSVPPVSPVPVSGSAAGPPPAPPAGVFSGPGVPATPAPGRPADSGPLTPGLGGPPGPVSGPPFGPPQGQGWAQGQGQGWAPPPRAAAPQMWAAPALPSPVEGEQQGPPERSPGEAAKYQKPQQFGRSGSQTPPAKRAGSFHLGVAAGVGIVILLSGGGIWAAANHITAQPFTPAAAEGPALPAPAGQADGPAPQVTVPWATATGPGDGAVFPLELPTDPSDPAPVPAIPDVTALPSVPLPSPPPVPTGRPTPERSSTRPTNKPRQPTTKPTKKPSAKPSTQPTGRPTPKPTAKPTSKPSSEPTTKPTTSAPKPPTKSQPAPTQRKTTPPATKPPVQASNPYTPQQVCNSGGHGSGFYVQRSSSFSGGQTYQLYSTSTGYNCVVTMKTKDIGKSTQVSASLESQGGGSDSDSGNYEYYAGPVMVQAKGKCVKYTGGGAGGSTSGPWANCG
jgi:hypothetical protein